MSHVHIATLGGSIEPVTKAINAIAGIDKIYLLHGSKFDQIANDVKKICESLKIEVELKIVDSFNFQNIVDNIIQIYRNESGKGTFFSINITGGTNLMAAAACSCAYFIGATIYYVHWKDNEPMSEQLETIPTPFIPNLSTIKGKTKDILLYVAEKTSACTGISSKEITSVFDIEKQNTGYHLKKLENEGLIKITSGVLVNGKVDSRQRNIQITSQGSLIAAWMRDDLK